MKRSLSFFVVLLGAAAGLALGQTKTVTNADLEKFRQQRLKAEKEYAENYAKWGFPSPEEVERQRVQSAIELSETSKRLTAERLERERVEAERQGRETQVYYVPGRQYSQPNFFNYAPYGFYHSRSYRPRRNFPVKGFGNFGGPMVTPPRSYLPPFVGTPPGH